MFKKFFYLPLWFLKTKFLGQRNPLQSVLFLHDYCNLNCLHCCIDKNKHIKPLEQVKEELRYCYSIGSRFVDFEGGETLMYEYLTEAIVYAKEIGFYSTTVTTNGQFEINTKADLVWVSLDGLRVSHDKIRGEGTFKRAIENIKKSSHKNININMVINKINYMDVEGLMKLVLSLKNVKRVAFNFHTPFKGTEELELGYNDKNEIIDKLLLFKKKKYPLMNSSSALRAHKNGVNSKNCFVTNFIMPDGNKFKTCQGKSEGLCDKCGFMMAAEMDSVMKLNPETILAGLKIR